MGKQGKVFLGAGLLFSALLAGALWMGAHWIEQLLHSPPKPAAHYTNHDLIEWPLPKGPLQNPDLQLASLSLSFELDQDFKPGGFVEFSQGYHLPHGFLLREDHVRYRLKAPQWNAPTQPNFLRVEGPCPTQLVLGPQSQEGRSIRCLFPEGAPAHSRFDLHLGDRSTSPGYLVPPYPIEIDWLLLASPKGRGKVDFCDSRRHRLVGTSADEFLIDTPSTIDSDEIHVRFLALHGRLEEGFLAVPATHHEGSFRVVGSEGTKVSPEQVTWTLEDRGCVEVVIKLLDVECRFLEILDPSGSVLARSPSFERVAKDQDKLYFGSLQNHSALGGHGVGLPTQALDVARSVSGLDFVALSEHAESLAFDWAWLVELIEEAHVPGEFVTFGGFEWTHDASGHRHVILKDPRLTPPLAARSSRKDIQVAPDLKAFERAVGHDPNALIVAHHTARQTDGAVEAYDWGTLSPSAVEVYSWHGPTDRFDPLFPIDGRKDKTLGPDLGNYVFEQIARGHTFAVLGDSDQHFARPGLSIGVRQGRKIRRSRSGLTGVWAPTLTREALFTALQERRCYATTGARIRLRFSVDGHSMGFDGPSPKPSLEVHIQVEGTAPITKLRLWRDGRSVIREWQPNSRDIQQTFQDRSAPDIGAILYHVTLTQSDGHRAWSSPIRIRRE